MRRPNTPEVQSTRAAQGRALRGFTLIEVMLASVILALAVAVIASAVMNAQLDEGHARRRAEASAYADRLLAEMEENAARGAAIELGEHESSEGAFIATIEVVAFDPSALQQAESGAPKKGPANPAPPQDEPNASGAGGWLATPEAEANPPVVQATIAVAFAPDSDAGAPEPLVRRTSFFLNPVALQALETKEAGDEEAPPE